jgi:hypothetical protein
MEAGGLGKKIDENEDEDEALLKNLTFNVRAWRWRRGCHEIDQRFVIVVLGLLRECTLLHI